MAYGDKNLFYISFLFIIEKFDFPVKMPPEMEVLWIHSFGYEWKIFILPFLDALGYTLSKKLFSYFGRFGEPWASVKILTLKIKTNTQANNHPRTCAPW